MRITGPGSHIPRGPDDRNSLNMVPGSYDYGSAGDWIVRNDGRLSGCLARCVAVWCEPGEDAPDAHLDPDVTKVTGGKRTWLFCSFSWRSASG
jgi:hypothetical protein